MKLRWLIPSVLAVGCAAHNIPGTQIADNADDRAILGVLERFRAAVLARDPDAIMELVSPRFHDDAGTPGPEDDLNYASLKQTLAARFAKTSDVSLDLSVRKIEVDRDVANAIYYYNTHFRLPKLTSKVQSEGDLKQMWFQREGGQWKIVSGI